MRVITPFVAVAGACLAVASAAGSQPPPGNAPPPTALADVRHDPAMVTPALLSPDAPRDAVMAWLAQNIPASHGHLVYINGPEAFWIEHQDIDTKNDMKIAATIHAENIADPGASWRSSYQVTQFDCEQQQQQHVYLTQYSGNNLSGEIKKDTSLIKRSEFVGPTTLDFAHVRAVCLAAYDQVRKRPYAVQMPAR